METWLLIRNIKQGISGDYLIFHRALREAKVIGPGKLADLLSWKYSGFYTHDGGEKSVPAHDRAGRKRLAEYPLLNPFSLRRIVDFVWDLELNRSNLGAVKKVFRMLEDRLQGLLIYLKRRITNAAPKGMNSLAARIVANARGLRTFPVLCIQV